MARKRKDATEPKIKLAHPDRSGPAPSEKTLLKWAEERNLFEEAKRREAATTARTQKMKKKNNKDGSNTASQSSEDGNDDDDEEENVLTPGQERVAESLLWTGSLAILHFTLDVLVYEQYAQEIKWDRIVARTAQAFVVFLVLFYTLHPHYSNPNFVPGLPTHFQNTVRQAIFFAGSVTGGCYLIYLTNSKGYLAVQKKAPPVACIWLWSVIELNLALAVASVACVGAFLWYGDYDIK